MSENGFIASLWFGRAILFIALLWSSYTDHQHRRIPNALSVILMLLGLLWHSTVMFGAGLFDATSAGGLGFKMSALGAATAFVVFFLFYLLRILGAGDVKLLTAVGAWVGFWGLLPLTLLVMISGGILALARMLETTRRTRTLVNLGNIGLQYLSGGTAGAVFNPKTDSADRLPYAWAILAGTAVYAIATFYGWWNWL